jgi:hypothetical protein
MRGKIIQEHPPQKRLLLLASFTVSSMLRLSVDDLPRVALLMAPCAVSTRGTDRTSTLLEIT